MFCFLFQRHLCFFFEKKLAGPFPCSVCNAPFWIWSSWATHEKQTNKNNGRICRISGWFLSILHDFACHSPLTPSVTKNSVFFFISSKSHVVPDRNERNDEQLYRDSDRFMFESEVSKPHTQMSVVLTFCMFRISEDYFLSDASFARIFRWPVMSHLLPTPRMAPQCRFQPTSTSWFPGILCFALCSLVHWRVLLTQSPSQTCHLKRFSNSSGSFRFL